MNLVVWIVVPVVVALMAAGVALSSRRRELTDQEFEDLARRPSLLRTGLQEFQSFLEPEKRAAIEVVEELKRKRQQQEQGELFR